MEIDIKEQKFYGSIEMTQYINERIWIPVCWKYCAEYKGICLLNEKEILV